MNPDKEPLFHAPFQQPLPPAPAVVSSTPPASEPEPSSTPKSKLLIAIGVAAIIELLVIIGLAVAVMSKSNPSTPSPVKEGATNNQAEGPKAANASNVQLIDDSISQDLSIFNDDQDFPADKFSDRSLSL